MSTEVSHIPWLGFIILSIVVGSLLLIILAAILGKPWKPKATMLAEKEFLGEHLMKWLPKFCGEVRKHDRLGLFHCLADLTEGWISLDFQQYLQEIK